MAKIILISGKGEHGKTTTANFIKQKLELFFDKRVVIVSFASYLKFVCEKYFGWNGKKDEEGRHKLQYVGTDVVRKKQPDFWVKTVGDFIRVFEDDFDFFIIDDCRFVDEVNYFTDIQPMDTLKIRVTRTNFESSLTPTQMQHPSETGLDNYSDFDLYIYSENGKDNLRKVIMQELFENNVFFNWLSE